MDHLRTHSVALAEDVLCQFDRCTEGFTDGHDGGKERVKARPDEKAAEEETKRRRIGHIVILT